MFNYENVLGRRARVETLPSSEIEALRKHRILITGAGGSIGSEIVSYIFNLGLTNFLATDHDESRLHTLSLLLDPTCVLSNDRFMLLDIRDPESIRRVFSDYKPTLVIHAAALKHLSMLEVQPWEALVTNVYGTKRLVDISIESHVEIFINISTDKAAAPTSVLGRSKQFAEMIVAHANKRSINSKYVSCRFGNVFASRGSVIETFSAQISSKMPLTLSSPEATRYFMAIPEAAYLSIKSIFLEVDDLYIFDMGDPVRMLDIANKMNQIARSSSSILISGLKKGEKLHEELSSSFEDFRPTTYPLILSCSLDLDSLDTQNALNYLFKEDSDALLTLLIGNVI
jgi:FlaA1/EpsC-like NDP-sugar epimerase